MTTSFHAIELEQSLLGAILLDAQALNYTERLKGDDFCDPLHRRLFDEMGRLSADGRSVTPVTLAPLFHGEMVGGITIGVYMTRMMGVAAPPMSIQTYAQSIREFAARRMLFDLSDTLRAQAEDLAANPVDTALDATRFLDDVVASARRHGPSRYTLGEAADRALAQIKAGKGKGITTGIPSLDKVLGGGWHHGELTIIGARPSMGKSAFAVSAAVAAARAGYGVMVFSLEMTAEMVALRAMSGEVWNSTTPLPYESLRYAKMDDHVEYRLNEAIAGIRSLPLVIDDQFGLTMTEVAARCRQQASRFEKDGKRLDLIILDHLGMAQASGRYAGQKVHEVGEKSKAFLGLAKDLSAAAMALHQLSRAVETRGAAGNGATRRPGLSDLRDSGNLEEDAHVAAFLYRPAYYLEREKFDDEELENRRQERLSKCQHDLEILVAKNRNGPCRNITAFIDIASNVIRDLDTRHA